MGWFDKFLGRSARTWTIDGVRFDTAGWTLSESTPTRMRWTGSNQTLALERVDEAWHPQTLTAFRDEWRTRLRRAGQDIVLVETFGGGGRTGLTVGSKRREGLAANYGLSITIPIANAGAYRIVADFTEGTFTGQRDALVSGAVVATMGLQLEDEVDAHGGRSIKGFFQDAYDAAFDRGALNSYTDDSRVDIMQPSHPLSRMRAWIAHLAQSIQFDDGPPGGPAVLDETPSPARGPRELLASATMRYLYDTANLIDPLVSLLSREIAAAPLEPTADLALTHLYLGCLECKRQCWTDAIAPLREAERLYAAIGQAQSFGTAEALTRLGVALAETGQSNEALAALRRAIPLFETFPSVHLEAIARSRAAVILVTFDTAGAMEEAQRHLTRAQDLAAGLTAGSRTGASADGPPRARRTS